MFSTYTKSIKTLYLYIGMCFVGTLVVLSRTEVLVQQARYYDKVGICQDHMLSLGSSVELQTPGHEVIKLFSCSAQLRLQFILLINVKMPTIVGILTFISRINCSLWGSQPEFSIYLGYFSFYEQFKFQSQLR